jgi:hypothetical protein
LTQGALLGSHRALDPDRTWYLHHFSTRSAVKPVIPGELTRYDVEIFPTGRVARVRSPAASDGDHLRLPAPGPDQARAPRPDRGSYQLHQGGPTPSHLLIPVADPDSFD